MVDRFNLKQMLVDNGVSEKVFGQGRPLNFEDAINIIRIATDWLIKFEEVKDYHDASEAVHDIRLNFLIT